MMQSGRLLQQVITLQAGQDKLDKKMDDFILAITRSTLGKANGCKD
jgi:hypothetical protein